MSCGTAFEIERLEGRAKELDEKITKPDFFAESNEGDLLILKELAGIRARLAKWREICAELDELEALNEILGDALKPDRELEGEFKARAEKLKKAIEREKIFLLLKGDYDAYGAILSVHAGLGGVDAQDWAQTLFRMYFRYCEREGLKFEEINFSLGEEAGIKSAEAMIEGDNAYGFLKAEKGVHRLIRLSPYDAMHKRHTSFASVLISPMIPESVNKKLGLNIDLNIKDEDLRIDTFRASGAGGQHVNRTDSAVRITHLPTGIVATCQNERSQHVNKQLAMKILRSRLYERELEARKNKLKAVVGKKKKSSWGSQIRSYILHPYNLVKDHRTGCETGNVEAVLDGGIDNFILEYLKIHARGEI